MTIENSILEHIRKWWRPTTGVILAVGIFVHAVFVPLYLLLCKNQYFSDLTGLAALITASGVPIAIREWGKYKGNQ